MGPNSEERPSIPRRTVDRGYQPIDTNGRPDATAGYQPKPNGPTNVAPKPPSGGSSIQPPQPAKK